METENDLYFNLVEIEEDNFSSASGKRRKKERVKSRLSKLQKNKGLNKVGQGARTVARYVPIVWLEEEARRKINKERGVESEYV